MKKAGLPDPKASVLPVVNHCTYSRLGRERASKQLVVTTRPTM